MEDDSDIRKMSQELNAKVTRLQSTLQRINAPNMRALEKLVVVAILELVVIGDELYLQIRRC